MNGVRRGILLFGVVFLSGCYVRSEGYIGASSRTTTPPPPPPSASGNMVAEVQVGQPQLGQGVTVVETQCVQGAQESCNGIDDNCNGQIDEGCGYSSGAIQITLSWNTGADVDLHVIDPSSESISYQHTLAASGGHLDHDARGECRPNEPNNRIENVYWSNPTPPRGTYRVDLHYWGECNTNAGPTTATLSVSVGGRVIGVYTVTLMPNQRQTLTTFQIS